MRGNSSIHNLMNSLWNSLLCQFTLSTQSIKGRKGLARISYSELEWIWVGLNCNGVKMEMNFASFAFPRRKSRK